MSNVTTKEPVAKLASGDGWELRLVGYPAGVYLELSTFTDADKQLCYSELFANVMRIGDRISKESK